MNFIRKYVLLLILDFQYEPYLQYIVLQYSVFDVTTMDRIS